ncbi:adenylate/guanylate cyclase [Shimia gijangensis]|uniref:Adenylate/guanylate cyclase n=1 Tax=Shimia gijangensis TaxID=1470563 RepID=A0A1M6NR85_9RHOB|nr:DUF427 domain-containing protein [Shimia gijangensis]SHJ98251.1 adenylate/guanylate cyclase [Shimia gijangensis]
MSLHHRDLSQDYAIRVEPLEGIVRAWNGDTLIAESTRAQVMYETRLPPAIYFPREDVLADLSDPTDLKTFCPFKGTARYRNMLVNGETVTNAVWGYDNPLPESRNIDGHIGFMPGATTRIDFGDNELAKPTEGHISAPLVDWLLRTAPFYKTPEEFTTALAEQLLANGVAVSRMSVMIWSLHPSIAGRHYIWRKGEDELTTMAPSYEIFDHPAFVESPLYHVSKGRGGVRQKIGVDYKDNSFPIIEDLRAEGASDYVAMPLMFSNGKANVLTITCDHPDGFTTGNLGLVFECSFMIGRIFEVFALQDTAQGVLETYVGKRTGARVLGGDIRRGDGDEIDAAIMFCDLRASSRLVQELGQADYIETLNEFFDTVTDCVHEHGGEVLKFIGDAVLAVFPDDGDADKARREALTAARDITDRLTELRKEGRQSDCSIGISFGRVTYGNIGSRERLDFTVIGHAANVAARLGDHGKKAGFRIVATSDFDSGECTCEPLGEVPLHNVRLPVDCVGVSESKHPN